MIPKITTLLILAKFYHTKFNENKLDTNSNSDINYGKIDNKIANLLNSTKKISFKISFFIFKTSLIYI